MLSDLRPGSVLEASCSELEPLAMVSDHVMLVEVGCSSGADEHCFAASDCLLSAAALIGDPSKFPFSPLASPADRVRPAA